jgi:hypothetical protein
LFCSVKNPGLNSRAPKRIVNFMNAVEKIKAAAAELARDLNHGKDTPC